MNWKFYLNASLGAMLFLAVVGCSDDEFDGRGELQTGKGIVFGASASYADDDIETKTEYGDYANDGNSQEINWLSGDQVAIYSPQSTGINNAVSQATYTVTPTGDGTAEANDPSKATLSGSGILWGTEDTQDFYAIYPEPSSISNDAIKNLVSFTDGKLTGYVPVNQAHTITKGGTSGWTATPVMEYMYMAALNEDFQVPDYDSENQNVSLAFMPLTTTLEVTIHGTAENTTPIVQLNVFAEDNQNIAGSFTCDLVNGTKDTEGYPQCEYQSSSTVRNMITVNTYYEDGGTQVPLTLGAGESITFNIFLLPHQGLSNLSLRVVGLNTSGKTMSLVENTTPIILNPHKKTRIQVNEPSFGNDPNNWISVLDDDVYISQLSIPGTANSFSSSYQGTDERLYKTQEATFEEQWNAGIRCFELKCPNNERGNSLDGVRLQCNGKDLGTTFGQAVEEIWNKVQGTGEFAMIIPFFENQGGREGNVTDFANDLNQFFSDHGSYKYVTYGRDRTLGEARGSLMFIARITSEEDDDNIRNDMPDPTQGVFIENWGSLKDNWGRRGYTTADGQVVDNWASSLKENTMEYYLYNRQTWSWGYDENWVPTNYPTRVESNVNFMHNTIRQGGSTGDAYIQDWSRVVSTARTMEINRDTGWRVYFYWPESYQEKYQDVCSTFTKAIADNRNKQGSTFYINSLDGYFIDWRTQNSYLPFIEGSYSGGGCGNIPGFAEQINNAFYNYILDYGENNIYGAMNIVLMDMVYESTGGTYLPSVIINNNFRFPLITAGSN